MAFQKDEYLQFVIRRETFKQRQAPIDVHVPRMTEEEERIRVGTKLSKSIKLKGKKDQSADADDSSIQGKCISRIR